MVEDGYLVMVVQNMVSLLSFYTVTTYGKVDSRLDGNFLVEQSTRLQKPFIFVAINYRLGFLGFLHSKELQEESVMRGEDYCPNLGLHDQRLGLEWVKFLLYDYVEYK
jgi:carboxylesterase type B